MGNIQAVCSTIWTTIFFHSDAVRVCSCAAASITRLIKAGSIVQGQPRLPASVRGSFQTYLVSVPVKKRWTLKLTSAQRGRV